MHPVVPIAFSGHLAVQALVSDSSGLSSEARTVHQTASKVVAAAERSEHLFRAKADALSRLAALTLECAKPDWDGADAAAIDPVAVLQAEQFLRVLPDGLPLPEFAAEPDGAISLDWIAARHRLFSVSIGPRPRLAYAWLDGTERGHGVVRFDGRIIPPQIVDGIRAIMTSGHAGLRFA